MPGAVPEFIFVGLYSAAPERRVPQRRICLACSISIPKIEEHCTFIEGDIVSNIASVAE